MKKIFIFISLAFLLIVSSCSSSKFSDGVKGNGNLKVKEIVIADYNIIRMNTVGDIVYEQKKGKPYLRLQADENLFDYFEIAVKNNTLVVETSKDINSRKGCRIYTNSAQLAGIEMIGVGKVQLIGHIEGKSLFVKNTGVSNIEALNLDYEDIAADNSGVGNITLGGKTTNLSARLSGVGNINTEKLDADHVDSHNDGIGKIRR